MSEKQGIIKAVVVLVVICFVISGALAVVNSFRQFFASRCD